MRLRPISVFCQVHGGRRSGYTLVEILVATTLTLILMTAVVTVFSGVGDGISKSRRALEQFDRLRSAMQQLRMDLQGLTVTLDGRPTRPEENAGYFELIEGGILNMPPYSASLVGVSRANNNQVDSTVGEHADVLMFTTRSAARPFQGRYALNVDATNPTLQSDVAEVAWFLRGTTLHRRVLLVVPGVAQNPKFAKLAKNTFFANNDISVRLVNGKLVPNSLGDLTKRENRFAHPATKFPFDARMWGVLGLPTLAECSSPTWMAKWQCGTTPSGAAPTIANIDMWDNADIAKVFKLPAGTTSPDQYLAQDAKRLADDVVLNNVIGFDVKVWEPAANGGIGGYVDLGYSSNGKFNPLLVPPQGPSVPRFDHWGSPKSGLAATAKTARVYDSYCFSYENEGIYNFNAAGVPVPVSPKNYPAGLGQWPAGTSTNGLADTPNGIVDDVEELITQPPYPVPLRGIQITVRCFEPDSRQIREITIEQDFLPK